MPDENVLPSRRGARRGGKFARMIGGSAGVDPSRRVPVKSIGRYTERHYCLVCGRKRKDCPGHEQ